MKISLGTDHAGYLYKEAIKQQLLDLGHQVVDFGTDSEQRCDYPAFIRPAAQAVSLGQVDRGIVLGGSGNGEAIAANRYHGVRCALCWDEVTATLCRQHNDANMISLGARMIDQSMALQIVDIWLKTPFEGGRHAPRLEQLDAPTTSD